MKCSLDNVEQFAITKARDRVCARCRWVTWLASGNFDSDRGTLEIVPKGGSLVGGVEAMVFTANVEILKVLGMKIGRSENVTN